jgi:hypothetical protein
MATLSFSSVPDILLENYGATIAEAITQQGPGNWLIPDQSYMGRLKAHGRITIGGADGNNRYPRDWGVHSATATSSSFGAGDSFPASTTESYDDALLDWKREAITMEWDNVTRLAAMGASRGGTNLISLDFEAKLKALIHGIEAKLFLDGTGNSGKDVDGARAWLSDSATYATIDQSANTFWQAVVSTLSGTPALTRDHMKTVIRSLWNRNVDFGSMEIWMDLRQFHAYQDLFDQDIQYSTSDSTAMGLAAVYNDGGISVPIFILKGVPTDEIWFMDMGKQALHFLDHVPEDELGDEDGQVMHEGIPIGLDALDQTTDTKKIVLKAYPQLVCEMPRNFGRITGLAFA